MIHTTRDLAVMNEVFPEAWHAELKSVVKSNNLMAVVRKDRQSGCCLLTFDGMVILYNLWTNPQCRNLGYAKGIAMEAVHHADGKIVLARYRKDEKNIENLFEQAGYDVIHRKEDDGFIIVAARSL